MNQLKFENGIAATLKRSPRRRTIGIKIHQGHVQVSAPWDAPIKEIEAFVVQKSHWIQRHLERQQASLQQQVEHSYASGEHIDYLGDPMRIEVMAKGKTHRDNNTLYLLNSDESKQQRAIEVANWYIDQAVAYLPSRIELWSNTMKLFPAGIKIRHYKTRWGSCDRNGKLQFNWLIMMAPERVVDYVLIHELAHLQHFNHSTAFWRLVERIQPDFSEQRLWLKNQTHLNWYI